MSRQVTDQLYIDLGYLTPEDYYTYQAEIESNQTCESTISCDASVIAGGVAVFASGDLPSFATLTCTISHIQGADLFAFSDAMLAAEVDRIRDNNIATTSAFDITTNASRLLIISANAPSEAFVSTAGQRVRYYEAATDAAFALSFDALRVKEVESLQNADFTLTADVSKIQLITANINSESALDATSGKIVQASSFVNSAFVPTLSVSVTKNTFAVLETTASLSTTARVIVSRNASMQSNASLSTTATILRKSASASLLSAFTLSADPAKKKLASATLTSQFALTANARENSRLVAALSSAFALSTNPTEYATGSNQLISTTESLIHFNTSPVIDVRGSGTPVVTKRDTVGTTTTITNPTLVPGKFGNTINTVESGYSYRIFETANINIVSDFTAEVWFNYQGDIPNYGLVDSNILSVSPSQSITYTASNGVVTTRDFSTSIWVYDKAYHDLAANNAPAYDWGLAGGTIYLNWDPTRITAPPAGQITDVIIPSGWNHFLISRSGTYWYFFINGVLKKSWFGSPNGSSPTAIAMGNGSIAGLYDEFRLRKDVAVTSNFKPSTTEYFPPNPQYVHYSYGLWNTTSALAADVQRVKLFSSTMQSTASSSISAKRYRDPRTTNIFVVSTQQTIGQKNAILQAGLTTTAIESITYKRFRATTSQLQATASQTTNATKAVITASHASAQASLTANNSRTRKTTVIASATATMNCNAIKVSRASSIFNAWATEISVVNKIGRDFIHADVYSAMQVQAKVTTDTPIVLASDTNLTTSVTTVLFAESHLQATTNLSITNDYLRRNESIQSVETSLNVVNERTRYNSAGVTAQASLTADTLQSKTVHASSAQTATTSIEINNQVVRLAQANLYVEAKIPFALAGIMVRYEAHLISEGFTLTAGQILHIDPYYQIKIEPEHRGLIITQEHRVITIEQETRVNKISGYKL